jgi:hypothetical protein
VQEGWYKGMTSDKRTGLVPSTYIDLTALAKTQERQAPQDLAPGDAPSLGLTVVCLPGHTPAIEDVHVGSPAHNAGLLEGDRILSVSATNVRTRTDVKGVSSDQLNVLLKQTFHAATLAGGRMIVEVERFGAVLFVELRPLSPPPAQEMHAAFGHSRNEYEFMALTREHLAREAVELLVSIHASSNRTDARSGMLGNALLRAPFGSEMHTQEVALLDADGRQVMLPDGQSARVVLSYRYTAEAAAAPVAQAAPVAHGSATAPAKSVEMNVRLNMEFSAAGPSGSVERRVFIQDLKQDLADAAGVATSDFNIRNVSPGSVLVAMNAPEKPAQEIQRQSLDPNSKLRSGKVTRFTEAITLGPPVPHPLPAHHLRLQNAPYQTAEGVVGKEQGVFGTSAYGAVLDKALDLGREGGGGVSAQAAQDHGKHPSAASDFPQLFPAHLWAPAGQVAGQVHKRQKGPDRSGPPSATAIPSMPSPPSPPIKHHEWDKRGDSNHADPKSTRAFSPPPSSAQAAATRPAFGPEALLPVLDQIFKDPPRQAPAGQVRKVTEGRQRQEEREQREQVTGPRASAATQGGGAAGAGAGGGIAGDGIAGMRLHVEVLQADLDKWWASGSVERREFSDGVVKDLSVGGGLPAPCFRLVNVMRGGPLMREPAYTSTFSSTSSVLEEVIVDVEVHGDASSNGRSEARSPLAAALNLQTQVRCFFFVWCH